MQEKNREKELEIIAACAPELYEQKSDEDIYAAAGRIIEKMGYRCAIFDDDGAALRLRAVSMNDKLKQTAKKLTGFDAEKFMLPHGDYSAYIRLRQEKKPFFVSDCRQLTTEALLLAYTITPNSNTFISKGISTIVDFVIKRIFPDILKNAILAPFVFGDRVSGYFAVFGEDITNKDIPTIQHFSQIVCSAIQIKNAEIKQNEIINELRATEEKLRESEEKYRHLYGANPDPLFLVDAETRNILASNEPASRLFGYSVDELCEMKITQISAEPEDTVEKMKNGYPGQIFNIPLRICRKKDGSLTPCDITVSFFELGGKIVSYGSFHDISNRVLLEEKLKQSEERYRIVTELTTDYIFILDIEDGGGMKMSFVTDNLYSQTGRTLEEVQSSSTWFKIVHPEDAGKVRDFLNGTIMKGGAGEIECRSFVKDGRQRWIRIYSRPVTRGGRIASIIGAVKDITERKASEEALRDSEEKFNKAFDSSPLAMAISNLADGCYIDVNNAFTNIIGYKKEEVLGKTSTGLGIIPDISTREYLINKLKDNKDVQSFEMPVRTKSGEIRYGAFSAAIMNLHSQEYLLTIMDDITGRKAIEEELERYHMNLEQLVQERTQQLKEAQDRLNESERLALMGKFAGSIAHELRNPLSVISGNTDLLRIVIPEGNEKTDRYISRIKKHVDRSAAIIQSVLELTRIDIVFKNNINLRELISEACASLKRSPEIRLDADINLPADCQILGDAELLHIALRNLFQNAVDSMPQDGRIGLIASIEDTPSPGSTVRISVSDTGHGIPARNLEHIFQPLFTTKQTGFGFGLSLVKIIVEKHGGTVTVDSEEGKGATFTVLLPARNMEQSDGDIQTCADN